MNNHIKFLLALYCIAAFIKAASAADVLIDSLDATRAATGPGESYKPGLAEPAFEDILILKHEKELKDKTYGPGEKFAAGEFHEPVTVLLAGLFLVGISIVGRNNFLKK